MVKAKCKVQPGQASCRVQKFTHKGNKDLECFYSLCLHFTMISSHGYE